MIAAENGGHGYRPGQWLFRHLDFRVAPGEVMAVLGPNGRGKTTLLRGLCGTLAWREGRVRLGGALGYVPQALATETGYTALEMVLMGRSRFHGRFGTPGRADVARAEACLDEVGLADVARSRFDRLSGGQRQLALLARALATDCAALVLDEPASALDLANQGVMLRLLRRLAAEKGLAILFTTHHPDHALAIAHQALLMLPAGEHLHAPRDEALSEANLQRLYGVPIRRVAFEGGETLVPMHSL
ncbi:ABC transporter ATP-binding protein [Rhodovarius crocodyli]|uniref:ABC transporter ATP-binding protein n=1 Tax=Rhodovarius crocodyli TaxID=1979269 RepID=A0A437LX52_9PROT|nr:ABC transporter ATP-binding protein [Rhodovarius crocodyli]RVT89988.1 ABC transporter ATP-binding protein [Rhodovarius crocodyli]